MKKLAVIAALALLLPLGACTVAMNSASWDTWIGRDWHDFNAATNQNCYASGAGMVTCPKALGNLIWYVNGNGIIQSWEYKHTP